MAALAVIAFGLVGYNRLALELFPDITYPSITVQTEFPDTAPQEVENLVTRPVEEAVGVLRGLQTIHSVSRAGISEVTLEFEWGSDMDLLSMEVREKLDRLILPEEATDPVVLRFDPSLDPIIRLALAGDDDLTALRRLADKQIKQDFETVKGVAAAADQGRARGGDPDRGRPGAAGGPGHHPRPGPPGGRRQQREPARRRPARPGQPVPDPHDQRVRGHRGDRRPDHPPGRAAPRCGWAMWPTVSWGSKEREEITRVDGRESVEISLYKEGDANTVTVARRLRERLADWQDGKLPEGASADRALRPVPLHPAGGGRGAQRRADRRRAGHHRAVAVPARPAQHPDHRHLDPHLGRRHLHRHVPHGHLPEHHVPGRADPGHRHAGGQLDRGAGVHLPQAASWAQSLFAAAVDGTTEVGGAVVASTLTTVAVFLPIVFVEGVAGQLFRDQALTVTFSLLASLVVAVTLIPMLSAAGRQAAPAPDEVAEALSGGPGRRRPHATGTVMTLGWFSAALRPPAARAPCAVRCADPGGRLRPVLRLRCGRCGCWAPN